MFSFWKPKLPLGPCRTKFAKQNSFELLNARFWGNFLSHNPNNHLLNISKCILSLNDIFWILDHKNLICIKILLKLHLDDFFSTIKFLKNTISNLWYVPKTRKIVFLKVHWSSLTLAKMILMHEKLMWPTKRAIPITQGQGCITKK